MAIRQWLNSCRLVRISGFQRLALLVIAVACLVPVVLDGRRIWLDRAVTISESNRDTANLARAIAQHAEDAVRMIDGAIGGFVERVEHDGTGLEARQRMQRFLTTRVKSIPSAKALSFIDARGIVIISSNPALVGTDLSARAFLAVHREDPSRASRIGAPVVSRIDGEWIIPVTRRVDGSDGTFAGVFIVTVDPIYFQNFYASFDIGRKGAILLASGDGLLLVRRPFDASKIATDLSKGGVFTAVARQGPVGSMAIRSTTDGVERLNSYRRVGAYPLVVAVALETEEVLQPWRTAAIHDLSASFSLAAMVAILGALLLRQAGRLAAAMAALATREGEYRLLADTGTDVIMHIRDGIRVYVSPASRDLLQYAPEELVGRPIGSMIHPDDRDAWGAGHGLSDPTAVRQATYRIRRRDGSYVWVEAHRSLLPDGEGFVVSIRDISRRKAAEQELHAAQAELRQANHALHVLARQDGLTGLANRRCFDDSIDAEMRRAMREGTTLSLIMIDIDHFKRFNDHYGHPAGDACLRKISRVVALNVSRPADLAVRYGGEELAVLLPNTTLAGAIDVANRILSAIRNLQLPHEASSKGFISASIGVASIVPTPDITLPAQLVEAADHMLYQAKHHGRDIVLPLVSDVQSADLLSYSPLEEQRTRTG
jgi:diguanylate cyclase (GGDEF)-like protein/PAS domain S-box-containing protein